MANQSVNQATARHRERQAQSGLFLGLVGALVLLAVVFIVHVLKVHKLEHELSDAQKQLTQAQNDAKQTHADLDKARSQSSDLQSQLDQAKSHTADLQAQLDQAKQSTGQMSAQFDKSKADMADLQTKLNSSKAQAADLQTQVTQANSGAAQLVTQLDQSKIQNMDLQTRLQKAENDLNQLQPLLLRARHIPLTTSLEKHGGSYTLRIKNLYLEPISVDVSISGPEKTRSQTNVIGGGEALAVDKLALGDTVVVSSDGYDPINLTVK
ncbi:MAG TPA: hypothetical protein VGF85_01765 [Opitutaceae bacterium]|jgi:septal ring factor EnvC (AmiA/AmiB activator)